MVNKEKLYETLGELLYVVAMADGVIQEEEKKALEEIVENHKWAKDISWSFKYEENKKNDIDYLYRKVIDSCYELGPQPEYNEFLVAMIKIAEASQDIDANESKIINSFSKDLIEKFKKDIKIEDCL